MRENEIVKREMNTGMQVRSIADLQAVGKWLAQSGMFGIANDAQGVVVAMACNQSGMNIMEFRETYHIIHGTPSMRTDAMLARFAEMGGTYQVKTRTADEARAVFEFKGCTFESSLTWAGAQAEPFVYEGKEADVIVVLAGGSKPKIKAKYATPRARMQMLWARVVSDGVRTVCPGANKGNYTPEEVADFAPERNNGPLTPAEVARRVEAAKPVDPVQSATHYEYCPIYGQFYGEPWTTLETEMLKSAWETTLEEFPELTQAHRDAIKNELDAREKEAG